MAPDAFAIGLALLARRELSTSQLRDRLLRRDFPPGVVERALERLRDEHALDDRRAAATYARTAVLVKRRGPRRVARELETRGIERGDARAAVDAVYADHDEQDVLERALARRLEGPVRDRAQFRRLYQYLLRQGFDAGMAAATLRARSKTAAAPDD